MEKKKLMQMKYLIAMVVGSVCFIQASGVATHQADTGKDITRVPASDQAQLYLADPTIFFDSGVYYLYGTGKVNKGFEVYTSKDLTHWRGPAGAEDGLALRKQDVYGSGGFWAPQVFKYGDKFYMAYAADEHVAIAESDSPLGPFTQKLKKPFHTVNKAIDPFVFIDDDGKKYLYFVRLQQGNRIYVAALTSDLSDIKPGTIRSCVNAVDQPQKWENLAAKTWTVTEGPTILKYQGFYYLFYSANGFKSVYYAVGYAVAKSPLGPWKKYSGNPILNKDMIGENGPGHGDFFKTADGGYDYVFHTHYSDSRISPRKTAVIKGRFVKDGDAPQMKFYENSFYYLKTP